MPIVRSCTLVPLLLPLAALAGTGGCSPAHAQAAAETVVLHWGDAVSTGAQAVAALLLPVAITTVTALVARLAGPLRLLVTNNLVERLVRNAADFAINAVAGAVRGRTLTIPLGSAVIAKAVQRALEQAPDWLVRAAGGRDGIAEKVFRALPLEDAATVANTLRPVLQEPYRHAA